MSRDETPDTTGLREAERDCDGSDESPLPCWPACCHPTPDASPDPAVVTPDAGGVLDEIAALELAEEVWEDEPTDAEQELMQRVLASDWLANHVAAAREADRAEVERLTRLAADRFKDRARERERRERVEQRLAGFAAQTEALADEWEAAHGNPPVDPSHISVRHAQRLRALIPADAATALDVVREKAKVEERERIAQAIEAAAPPAPHTITPQTAGAQATRAALLAAARIARRTPGATS